MLGIERRKRPAGKNGEAISLRVASYVRVSTEEQAQSGYSLEGQKEKIQIAAKLHAWDLLEPYVDDGYSGKDLKRPAMQRLLSDAQKKKFDLIAVYKLDRLSRRLADLTVLVEEFQNLDIGIVSVTEPFDTTNPVGKLLFNMLGSFAQFEREIIIERTRMGMQRRQKEGKWNGLAPFGYRITEAGILHIDKSEEPVARKIFDLFLKENLGAKLIARRMRIDDHTSCRSGKWARNSVSNMLNNPVYAGLYRIEDELVDAPHPGIISKQEFHRIQKVLSERTNLNARLGTSPNVLTGLVKCGLCGSTMTTGKGKGIYYYFCAGQRRDNGCALEWIPAKRLEEAVLKDLSGIAASPELIEQYLLDLKLENSKQSKALLSERVSIEKQLEGARKAKDAKVQWLLTNLPDKSVADEVSLQVKKQIGNIAALDARLREITGQLQQLGAQKFQSEAIAQFLSTFGADYDALNNGQKRVIIQGLVKEVCVFSKDQCNVEFAIPLPFEPQSDDFGIELERRPFSVENAAFPTPPANGYGTGLVHLSALNGVADGT